MTGAGLPVYNANFPPVTQNDDWSCAPTSMRWCLWAYGREPGEVWLEGSMLDEHVVSREQGLLDATGAGLASWANRHYGADGYVASHDPDVSFEDLRDEVSGQGQAHPCCIGGRRWYHWSGLRGSTDDSLLLANPAPNWHDVGQVMTREEFALWGPFSLVRLTHPAAEAGASPSPIPPVAPGAGPGPGDPFAPWRGMIGSGILEMMAQDGTLPAQRASTWLPLGGPPPADIEMATGQQGTQYHWQLTTGKGFRYRASTS